MPKKKKTLAQLETIYTHGSDSYRQLADKYGVSFQKISYYASRNNWVEKRRQFRDKVRTKADNKEANRQADKLIGIGQAADELVEVIKRTLADPKQFQRRVYITDEGVQEEEVETVNIGAIRQLTGALKTLTDVIRDVYNLPKAEKPKEQVEITITMPEEAQGFDV